MKHKFGPVPTYEEYKDILIKYSDTTKCIIYNCDKPGLYEGGDARCWCPMCEEHAEIERSYRMYLNSIIGNMDAAVSRAKMYEIAKNKVNKIHERLEEALNGPEPGEIKQNLS